MFIDLCIDLSICQAHFTSQLDDIADEHHVPRSLVHDMVLSSFMNVFNKLDEMEAQK